MSHRTEKGFLPRFGRTRVIQVLLGSKAREVSDAQLDRLSTYGLLKEKSANYLHDLFRELEEARLLYSTGGQYPTISLTPAGVEVMLDRSSLQIVWPAEPKTKKLAKAIPQDSELPFDVGLFEELRKLRARLAAEEDGIPNYLIFSDETLKSFARVRPRSPEAARRIRGVGEMKMTKYVPAFLEVIRNARDDA
jgi:ATP-dependent DNA helicase RecQ